MPLPAPLPWRRLRPRLGGSRGPTACCPLVEDSKLMSSTVYSAAAAEASTSEARCENKTPIIHLRSCHLGRAFPPGLRRRIVHVWRCPRSRTKWSAGGEHGLDLRVAEVLQARIKLMVPARHCCSRPFVDGDDVGRNPGIPECDFGFCVRGRASPRGPSLTKVEGEEPCAKCSIGPPSSWTDRRRW